MLELISGFALGCATILAFAIVNNHFKLAVGRTFLALVLATCGFLLHPYMPANIEWITTDLQTMIPALFWLLCLYAFSSRPNIVSVWTLIALYSVIVPAIYIMLPAPITDINSIEWAMMSLSGYFEYLLIAAGVFVVLKHWSDDLVESRRRLRLVVIIVAGVSVCINVISVNYDIGNVLFQRGTVAIALLIISINLLRISKGTLFGTSVAPLSPPSTQQKRKDDPKTLQQLDTLNELMLKGFYSNENLTLAKLASEIGLPEYLTRTLINEHLGYRNFNDYLNKWRIDSAKKQLKQEIDKPISNIALDLGYRTLSSFNRAFKDRTEVTPTQYRNNET